jgi:hypothetical protein
VLRRVDEAQREMRQQAMARPMVSAAAPAPQANLLGVEPASPRPEARRSVAAPPVIAPPPRPPSAGPAPAAMPTAAAAPVSAPAPSTSPPRPSSSAPAAAAAAPADADLATAWERVVEEVMKKKPTLGAVLMQARPSGVTDRELTIVLHGNHFHREMLADVANRDLVVQAVRRNVPGVERFSVVSGGESPGAIGTHPAVQAAIAEFQGEVVAVRPRSPGGEGQ